MKRHPIIKMNKITHFIWHWQTMVLLTNLTYSYSTNAPFKFTSSFFRCLVVELKKVTYLNYKNEWKILYQNDGGR